MFMYVVHSSTRPAGSDRRVPLLQLRQICRQVTHKHNMYTSGAENSYKAHRQLLWLLLDSIS